MCVCVCVCGVCVCVCVFVCVCVCVTVFFVCVCGGGVCVCVCAGVGYATFSRWWSGKITIEMPILQDNGKSLQNSKERNKKFNQNRKS